MLQTSPSMGLIDLHWQLPLEALHSCILPHCLELVLSVVHIALPCTVALDDPLEGSPEDSGGPNCARVGGASQTEILLLQVAASALCYTVLTSYVYVCPFCCPCTPQLSLQKYEGTVSGMRRCSEAGDRQASNTTAVMNLHSLYARASQRRRHSLNSMYNLQCVLECCY